MAHLPFLVNPPSPPAVPEVLDGFRNVPTPHISDNLRRLSGVGGLRRYHRGRQLLGTAFTVKTRPGDNLVIYRALTMMSPGHVLVVDGGGETTNALVGELIMKYAQKRGCVGFVLDGAIRDVAAFCDEDFPCYAKASTHRGPYKDGPGAINVPVCAGGQVVLPGDIVVGDADGLVTFPQAAAVDLIEAIRQTTEKENRIIQEIATGAVAQSWIEKTLAAHGL